MMKYIELSNPIVKFWCFQNEQKDTEAQFDNDVGPVERVLFYLYVTLLAFTHFSIRAIQDSCFDKKIEVWWASCPWIALIQICAGHWYLREEE